MTTQFSLKSIIKKHKLTITGVVFLSIIESLLFVAQFYFIGTAIDGLLKDTFDGIYILIGLFLIKLIVSYIKQIRVSKTYTEIYEQLIRQAIGKRLLEGEKIEVIAPKNVIIHETANFFKYDLIRGFETIVRLILVLLILSILNYTIFLVCFFITIIVFLLYRFRRKTTVALSKEMANEFQEQYKILHSRNLENIYRHHHKLERIDGRLMGISGFNLAIIEAMTFGLIIFAIVYLVSTEGQNAISAFITLLYYVLSFSDSMFLLPSLYQKYLKIQTISEKIA